MCTKTELEKILRQICYIYDETYPERVCAVYLYGSYARGTSTVESDIDIVAIVKGDRPELQQQLKKIWDIAAELGVEYDVVISPTVIPYEEFENYKEILPYYRNIVLEGVKLSA